MEYRYFIHSGLFVTILQGPKIIEKRYLLNECNSLSFSVRFTADFNEFLLSVCRDSVHTIDTGESLFLY
jgi:hypothetical protein